MEQVDISTAGNLTSKLVVPLVGGRFFLLVSFVVSQTNCARSVS